MKYDILDQSGKKIGDTSLPEKIFGAKADYDLIHQVTVSQSSNKRQVLAHTKDRGEVSGGGKKPWRQKGLGRARHGSIRSPIWVGGGVSFGPRKDVVFKKRIPRKMKRAALLMVLSEKFRNGLIVLLDKLEIKEAKTKTIKDVLQKLPVKDDSALIALPDLDRKIILSARNITKVQTIQARDLNCLDLLSFKFLVMPKESIKVIEETFLRNRKKKAETKKKS
jgi:large subunit ribosomal protein L4